MTLTICVLGAAIAAVLGTLAFQKLVAHRTGPITTKKTQEMEKLARRASRVPAQDLALYLEQVTVDTFESAHAWYKAQDPVTGDALAAETLQGAKTKLVLLQEAMRDAEAHVVLLEEQQRRSKL